MDQFARKLCEVERDRVTAAEVCIDELLTIMGRHDEDGAAYNMLINLSAELHSALTEADGLEKRRARLIRIRDALTTAFPMTDADLQQGDTVGAAMPAAIESAQPTVALTSEERE